MDLEKNVLIAFTGLWWVTHVEHGQKQKIQLKLRAPENALRWKKN